MTTDDRLAELLRDAVSDVEPADRLADIRARTASPAHGGTRPWFYAAGASTLAAAAAVTAFAVLGGDDQRDAGPIQPDTTEQHLVAAYYLGDSPRGLRLFREFDRVPADDKLAAAVSALQSDPTDPDYSTPWAPGSFTDATYNGDVVSIELADAALHDRPSGMSDQEAQLAVQQVVYTLQGAVGQRAGVQFVYDGNPIDQVYGVPTSEPLANAPQVDVLNLVSISDPADGLEVSGSFTARGVASSHEATVPWEIRRGDEVVEKGFATAEGWMDKLYPWETKVDVSGLEPGMYTFVAMTSDPSGGAEGFGPDSDTRTIVVR